MTYRAAVLLILLILITGCADDGSSDGTGDGGGPMADILAPEDARAMSTERWVTSKNEQITLVESDGSETTLTSGYADMKASWAPDDALIVFMRVVQRAPLVRDWKTRICVIGADGSGFKELTSGQYADYNPTWARDGSSDIIFYRRAGLYEMGVFRTSYDRQEGEEEMLSDPAFMESAPSVLSDGRIFVDRFDADGQRSYLMTPGEGGAPIYEEISRPTDLTWHKLSISPGETKVAYMLAHGDSTQYNNSTLCVADFDVETLTISNQVEFTDYDLSYVDEYPRWSSDESVIIFDSTRSGRYQAYLYRLDDGALARISPDEYGSYGYSCCFENVPK